MSYFCHEDLTGDMILASHIKRVGEASLLPKSRTRERNSSQTFIGLTVYGPELLGYAVDYI